MLFSFDLWFSTWIYVFSTWIYVFSVLIYDFLPWFMFFNLDLCFSVLIYDFQPWFMFFNLDLCFSILIYDFQPWFMFCWGKGGLKTIKNSTSWFFWFLSPPLVASCRCGGGRAAQKLLKTQIFLDFFGFCRLLLLQVAAVGGRGGWVSQGRLAKA